MSALNRMNFDKQSQKIFKFMDDYLNYWELNKNHLPGKINLTSWQFGVLSSSIDAFNRANNATLTMKDATYRGVPIELMGIPANDPAY